METQVLTLKDELVRAREMLRVEPDLKKELQESLRLTEWYKSQVETV